MTYFINILNLLYYAMRKSEQYSVAIFLAVALFAGTLAGSAPAFVVDAQATEDKRDYKERDRHDDNKRYGEEKQYSKDRDGRDGHDGDKSSVKYIKCNNVNINGKDRNSHGGDEWPRGGGNEWPGMGGGNEWPRGGEENGFSHDSFMKRDNHNFPGFIKQTDKDVVVICIFNNDGKKDKVPPTPVGECNECIEDLPGLSPGENPQQPNGTGIERDFIEFVADNAQRLGIDPTGLTVEEILDEFCENLTTGLSDPVYTEGLITALVEAAIPGEGDSSFQRALIQCLTDLIPIPDLM